MNYLARCFRCDDVGLLNRHVTVDAVIHDRMPDFGRHSTTLPRMTLKAFRRVGFGSLSAAMNVVTGRTTHLRRGTIALAAFEQANLVAMNIRVFGLGNRKGLVVLVEWLAWTIRECWKQWLPLNSVVAFGAEINLPVTRKRPRIQDAGWVPRSCVVSLFKPNVICSRPMTTLA